MRGEALLKHIAWVAAHEYGLTVWQWLPGPVGTHAANSLHYERFADGVGKAFDVYGSRLRMIRFRRWLKRHHPYLSEGIWNSGFVALSLSVKNGSRVPPSFWGSETWKAHKGHMHIGIA